MSDWGKLYNKQPNNAAFIDMLEIEDEQEINVTIPKKSKWDDEDVEDDVKDDWEESDEEEKPKKELPPVRKKVPLAQKIAEKKAAEEEKKKALEAKKAAIVSYTCLGKVISFDLTAANGYHKIASKWWFWDWRGCFWEETTHASIGVGGWFEQCYWSFLWCLCFK